MSLTLDKLKALRRQAGGVATTTAPVHFPHNADARADGTSAAPTTAIPRSDTADAAASSGGNKTGIHAAPPLAAMQTVAEASGMAHARADALAPASAPRDGQAGSLTPLPLAATTPAGHRVPTPVSSMRAGESRSPQALCPTMPTAPSTGVPPPAPTRTGLPAERSAFDWIAAREDDMPARGQPRDVGALRRLLATRERLPATTAQAAPRASRHAGAVDRHLPGNEIAPGLWKTEVFLPQPVPAAPLPLAFAKRPDDAVAARELLFFDTETTGLAGGTGTRAFMIGAADWHVDAAGNESLRVRQLTMATLGAEPAMLREFAGWLGPRTVLSSYNGRCYDAPLLKTRYRLARLAEPLSALDHVDLLFPARRHWRGRWENCRLATIERQVLGIVREDDLPGSEAPAAWLRFLRGGSAVDVRRVAAHNHQDVVTLARLFLQLVEAQAAVGDTGAPAQ